MTSPLALPLLSLLVWSPAAGALLVSGIPEGRRGGRRAAGVAFGLASLALAGLLAARFDPSGGSRQLVELRSWTPALGWSYELALDGLGLAACLWFALLATLALVASDGDRDVPLLLAAESCLLGLAASRDAVLFLSFQGALLVAVAGLLREREARRRWLAHQLVGLVLFVGLALFCYWLVLAQTGFPSADLARFADLVVFPEEERRLFVLAGLGAAVSSPVLPFVTWLGATVESLSRAGRILFLGGVLLAPLLALLRLALPVTPDGAASWSGVASGVALASVAYGVLGPYRGPRRRSFVPLVAGLQGLAIAAILASRAGGSAPVGLVVVQLGLGLGLAALFSAGEEDGEPAPRQRGLGLAAGLLVVALFAWPLGARWLDAAGGGSSFLRFVLGLGVLLMALRLLRSAAAWRFGSRALLAVPVLASWLLLLAAPAPWRDALAAPAPSAPSVDSPEPAVEEEP